jgi:hypothetical protein
MVVDIASLFLSINPHLAQQTLHFGQLSCFYL